MNISQVDNWDLLNNCTDFATSVWNDCSNQKFVKTGPIYRPDEVRSRIQQLNYKSNRTVTGNLNNVGYYEGLTFISIN